MAGDRLSRAFAHRIDVRLPNDRSDPGVELAGFAAAPVLAAGHTLQYEIMRARGLLGRSGRLLATTFVFMVAGCGVVQGSRRSVATMKQSRLQLVGRIGYGFPFLARLAVAPDGWLAVMWARSPTGSGTPVELVTARPGGRFSRPQTVARVPFGTVEMAAGISDRGAALVALAPAQHGLRVIERLADGRIAWAQQLVNAPTLVLNLSLAMQPDGAALLAWTESSQSGRLSIAHAAWRRPGPGTFGRPQALGDTSSPPEALFVSSRRGAVGLIASTGASAATRPKLVIARLGHRFGQPISLAPVGTVGARFAADGLGGVFATLLTPGAQPTYPPATITLVHVLSNGHAQKPMTIVNNGATSVELSSAARGQALLAWRAPTNAINAVMLTPDGRSAVPNTIKLGKDEDLAAASSDQTGRGIIAWTRTLKPPPGEVMPIWQISYSTFSARPLTFCSSHVVARSTTPPELALDRHDHGFLLWTGARAAGGPINVLTLKTANLGSNCS